MVSAAAARAAARGLAADGRQAEIRHLQAAEFRREALGVFVRKFQDHCVVC
jgi:hypothetical protein